MLLWPCCNKFNPLPRPLSDCTTLRDALSSPAAQEELVVNRIKLALVFGRSSGNRMYLWSYEYPLSIRYYVRTGFKTPFPGLSPVQWQSRTDVGHKKLKK